MKTATSTTVYERTLAIDASPETIWEFFVDPEKAKRWMGIDMDLDAQPGGVYRCQVIPGHTALGEFVEVDRPSRIVFTWGWDGNESEPPGSSTVEIELTPVDGGTNVRFQHHFATADARASHGVGWDHYLPRLEIAAAGGEPGPDPWVTDPPSM
jgi:uncharacterized protein YndB with AHSA1/START domain